MKSARLKKITNTTDVPTETVREILRFVRPENIRPIDYTVRITNARSCARGRYLGRREPHVIARVAKNFKPFRMALYQYAQNKGKKVTLCSKTEALVYILAHEMRHLWQHHGTMQGSSFPTGYAKNARGRFSEVDTECYAVHMLRAWRRQDAPGEAAEPAVTIDAPAVPAVAPRAIPAPAVAREARLLKRRQAAMAKAAVMAKQWRTRAKRAATLAKRWERRLRAAERRLRYTPALSGA